MAAFDLAFAMYKRVIIGPLFDPHLFDSFDALAQRQSKKRLVG
jgi:hypothetical protein